MTTQRALLTLLALLILVPSAYAAGPKPLKLRWERPAKARTLHTSGDRSVLWSGRYPNGVVFTAYFAQGGTPSHRRAAALWRAAPIPGALNAAPVQRLGKGSSRVAATVWRRSSDRWHVLSAARPLGVGFAMIELASPRDNLTSRQVENALAVTMEMRFTL